MCGNNVLNNVPFITAIKPLGNKLKVAKMWDAVRSQRITSQDPIRNHDYVWICNDPALEEKHAKSGVTKTR